MRICPCAQYALQVAVDVGLPGLIACLALVGLVFAGAWQVYRRGRASGDGWLTGLGAGLLAGQIALAVYGLTDAVDLGHAAGGARVGGVGAGDGRMEPARARRQRSGDAVRGAKRRRQYWDADERRRIAERA